MATKKNAKEIKRLRSPADGVMVAVITKINVQKAALSGVTPRIAMETCCAPGEPGNDKVLIAGISLFLRGLSLLSPS